MKFMDALFWWSKQLFILMVSGFFFVRGIEVLIGSYGLDNPLNFIMYFFSSSLLILVSASIMLYPIFRIYGRMTADPGTIEISSEKDEP